MKKCINEKDIIEHREIYEQKCPLCKMKMSVITQKDHYPEYHTNVYIQCHCGNYVLFILPVN